MFLSILLFVIKGHAQEGNFIESNGVKLYYETHGEGEVLLLLHGNTMTHDMWTPWVEDLSKEHRVITVDMRGHGQSNNPTTEFSHKESAIDFYGLLDKLEVDEFKAMGFSSGSLILTHMATMDTTRIKSLVLIGATSHIPVATRSYMRGLTYENVSKNNPGWMAYMNSVQPGGEDQVRSVLNNYVQWADIYDDINFTASYLSTITCPTLIIHGDRDPLFSVDIPVSSYEAIPNSYLWIIPNFVHTTPEKGTALGALFIETVTQFLAGNWGD